MFKRTSHQYRRWMRWASRFSFSFVLMLCSGLLQVNASEADQAQYAQEKYGDLFLELSKAKLSKAGAVVSKIEQKGGEEVLPLLTSMLEGQLFYDKSNKAMLYRAVKTESRDYQVFDVLSGEERGVKPSKTIKKIKVNNRLRIQLRGAIARINLASTDVEKRLAAVSSMLGSVDKGTAKLLEALSYTETDDDIIDAINLNLALFKFENGDVSEKIQALALLQESVEPSVRNEITSVVESYEGEELDAAELKLVSASKKALKNIDGKLAFYGRVEQLFFGLSMGSVLVLAAMGLAITFGVMGVINMAHGEMMMLGAYTTYVVQLVMVNSIGYSIWVAIPMAFLVSGLVGILIQQLVIRHLTGRPLETLLATFGISLILQQAVRTIFSPLNRQVATPEWMSGSLEINAALSITYNRLYIFMFALIVFAIVLLIMNKTSLGLKVRAVSQNRQMAKAMGIRTGWVDAMTFGLGSGIAGVAGVALSQLTNVGPNLGQGYIIDSFMVVVFGGVGNLFGTLIAGFTLGVGNKFLEPVVGAMLSTILILVFIILFIQKRPQGLFPQKGRAAND